MPIGLVDHGLPPAEAEVRLRLDVSGADRDTTIQDRGKRL